MSFLKHTKGFSGLGEVFSRDPKRYLPLMELVEEVMTGESSFTHAERELIALHVSQINGCSYCVGSHSAVARHLGTDVRVVDSIVKGDRSGVDARMRGALDFAEKLTRTPGQVGQGDVDAVIAAGLSDQAVEDLIAVTSVFNLFNRLVDGVGLEGSAAGFEQSGQMFAKQGYAPVVQMLREKVGQPAS